MVASNGVLLNRLGIKRREKKMVPEKATHMEYEMSALHMLRLFYQSME